MVLNTPKRNWVEMREIAQKVALLGGAATGTHLKLKKKHGGANIAHMNRQQRGVVQCPS